MLLALLTSAASLSEPPSAPALSEGPSLRARVSARPRLKVLKRLQAKGNRLLLGGSCDSAGRCSFEAKCAEPLLGGTIALSGRSLRWSRLWLLPGLADAATRVELCSAVDLRTGKPDAELRLGLRRAFSKRGSRTVLALRPSPLAHATATHTHMRMLMQHVPSRTPQPRTCRRRGLSLVHALPLSLPLGGEQVGATLDVPAEVTLSARDPRAALRSARFSVDIDRADLCVEY